MIIKILLLFTLILPYSYANAGWKFRAREHFDLHSLSVDGGAKSKFSGLSNTITWGHEVKGKHYLGLYFNPVLASMAEAKDNNTPYADKIKLLTAGLTAKNFFPWSGNFFSRGAIGWTQLTSNSQTRANGVSLYAAAGYEWFFKKHYSLAPEFGYRHSMLERDTEVGTFTFSLAFHIYKL